MLDLLLVAGPRILVPAAVAGEVAAYGNTDATLRALNDADWLEVIDTPPVSEQIASFRLGAGESAVLAWALAHPGTVAILDEARARRRAGALGIPVRGTLGLILYAKTLGIIQEARPMIERVRQAGLYVSDRLLEESLRVVGE